MKRHIFWIGLIWLAMIGIMVGCSPSLPDGGVNGTTITECDCPICKTCPPCNCPTVSEAQCPDCPKCEVCETCINNTELIKNINVFVDKYNNLTGENLSISMVYP